MRNTAGDMRNGAGDMRNTAGLLRRTKEVAERKLLEKSHPDRPASSSCAPWHKQQHAAHEAPMAGIHAAHIAGKHAQANAHALELKLQLQHSKTSPRFADKRLSSASSADKGRCRLRVRGLREYSDGDGVVFPSLEEAFQSRSFTFPISKAGSMRTSRAASAEKRYISREARVSGDDEHAWGHKHKPRAPQLTPRPFTSESQSLRSLRTLGAFTSQPPSKRAAPSVFFDSSSIYTAPPDFVEVEGDLPYLGESEGVRTRRQPESGGDMDATRASRAFALNAAHVPWAFLWARQRPIYERAVGVKRGAILRGLNEINEHVSHASHASQHELDDEKLIEDGRSRAVRSPQPLEGLS